MLPEGLAGEAMAMEAPIGEAPADEPLDGEEGVVPSAEEYAEPAAEGEEGTGEEGGDCLLYTSPSPRDGLLSRMPSSA